MGKKTAGLDLVNTKRGREFASGSVIAPSLANAGPGRQRAAWRKRPLHRCRHRNEGGCCATGGSGRDPFFHSQSMPPLL
jgi:hypothetical protein